MGHASWQKTILNKRVLVAQSKAPFKIEAMKRIGNLYDRICSIENLELADQKARKGKRTQYGVMAHDQNRAENIRMLHEILTKRLYKTSPYTVFKIYEPKEREIFRLPYFPDRILHHAIMNIVEDTFVSSFTADTYSCIKGRGIKLAADRLKLALRMPGTEYCLKLDVKKFYPNIDHRILKSLLRRKFKDQDLLLLLDEIVDSAPGCPIGNLLSQYFANFYLTYFDHWIKEDLGIKHYFRYCDDLVILSGSKEHLRSTLASIRIHLHDNLKLEIKSNYQIFPVESRGIDFVGYVFKKSHTRLRKTIKKSFARMLANNPNQKSIASYNGWAVHCDSRHLMKKLLHAK